MVNYFLNRNYTIITLIVSLYIVQKSEHFLKPESLGANVKVELDLFIMQQSRCKNATEINASDFSTKTNFADFKYDVDKLDIDKF